MAFSFFKKKSSPSADNKAGDDPSSGSTTAAPEEGSDIIVQENPPSPPAESASVSSHDDDQEKDSRAPSSSGFYQRLRKGLSKTRQILTTDIDQLFKSGKPVSPDTLDNLEERLITADIGVKTAMEIIEQLSGLKISSSDDLKNSLKDILRSYLMDNDHPPVSSEMNFRPWIILVVGVNGVGKTTTIGKLAAQYIQSGKKVMLVAGDTFRAAAIEQLEIWAQRTGADFVKHRENSDPAAVVFDGLEAAQARGVDIVLIDTAGRLHTKTNLMEELKKIKRTITKKMPDAPHEVLLVLDATTGQNALSQAEMFIRAADVTGIALTKLDGTAKGGIAVNLCRTFHVPLRFIGIGEQVSDLQPFDAEKFTEALL
ncbi:MAG: signal recognition particle-docking protein FtsY [Thermodesulfobacteriota bacterium]